VPVPERSPAPFPATRWSLVLRLRTPGDETSAQRTLAELCRTYWYPLYAFARRKGISPPDAEDATQGFFAMLLSRNLFAAADPQLGKLRTFLLSAFERYLGDVRDRERAQKRGGDCAIFTLDVGEGERRYAQEPADSRTPERFFERKWATSVLRAALVALAMNETRAGRDAQFRALKPFLSAEAAGEPDYAAAAASLGMREDAVRQAVSRLRRKFRESLRQEIADTLRDPAPGQIEEELTSLRLALRS
jgi:RNA polymerase sigma-70 factor (ECF subfamily)